MGIRPPLYLAHLRRPPALITNEHRILKTFKKSGPTLWKPWKGGAGRTGTRPALRGNERKGTGEYTGGLRKRGGQRNGPLGL